MFRKAEKVRRTIQGAAVKPNLKQALSPDQPMATARFGEGPTKPTARVAHAQAEENNTNNGATGSDDNGATAAPSSQDAHNKVTPQSVGGEE